MSDLKPAEEVAWDAISDAHSRVGPTLKEAVTQAITADRLAVAEKVKNKILLEIGHREAKHRHDCRDQRLSTQRRNQTLSHRAEAEECFQAIRALDPAKILEVEE